MLAVDAFVAAISNAHGQVCCRLTHCWQSAGHCSLTNSQP